MKIDFFKYHGTGNDFIIIDNRKNIFKKKEEIIKSLCHRRFGIGADGLILLELSPEAHFSMKYFNADGKEGSMCGNGGRCAAAFAHHILKFPKVMTFMAFDGLHQAIVKDTINNETFVEITLKNVDDVMTGEDYYFLNTGSPHYVTFVENADDIDVINIGRTIRYSPKFAPNGTNVNFVEKENENTLYVRTYERGVEDETLSCGTGVVAAAISASENSNGEVFNIITKGGKVKVMLRKEQKSYTNIKLEGPATYVFSGAIEL